MAEGYCVKCKAKKEIANGVEETMKNGRKAIKGKCPTCGTVMFKILGGKAAPASRSRTANSAGHELIMSQQLAYVIITPYSLYKSRTGGILSRLISRTGLDLAAVRMFAPSAELVKQYAETIVSAHDPQDRNIQELLQRIRPQQSLARPQNRPAAARDDAAFSAARKPCARSAPSSAISVPTAAAAKPSATPTAT